MANAKHRFCALFLLGATLLAACGGSQDYGLTPYSISTTSTTSTVELTTTSTLPPPSCAQGGECQLGDTGPGGGTVVYVSDEPFSNKFSDCAHECHFFGTPSKKESSACGHSCHYLEMFPRTLGPAANWEEATKRVSSFNGGGKTDWFLPTVEQVWSIRNYCQYIKDDTGEYGADYWTSTYDSASGQPFYYEFESCSVAHIWYGNLSYIRAFRAG